MARGHLRKRGDTYQACIYVGTINGKKRYHYRTIRRLAGEPLRDYRRRAELEAATLVVEVGHGHHAGPDSTLTDYLHHWAEWAAVARDWSPKTQVETRLFIDNTISPQLGHIPLARLRPADIDTLYTLLRGRGLAASSVRRIHNVLRPALAQAVRWGWLATNPAAQASPPRVGPTNVGAPDAAAVHRILAAASEASSDGDHAFEAFVRLAAASGARRGELCALRWPDIDLETGRVRIARSLADGPGGIVEKDTKTHSARNVPLDAATVALLRVHRADVEAAAAAVGTTVRPDGYVFSWETDGSGWWRPDNATHRFAVLRAAAKAPGVRFHDLRHYSASRLIDGGVPVATVSRRLGHRRTSTTTDIYVRAVDSRDQEAADTMGRILGE